MVDPAVRTSYLYSMDKAGRARVKTATGNCRQCEFAGQIKLAPCFRNRRR